MFKVEKNIPIPSGGRKATEKEELSKVLMLMNDGESIFVEHDVIAIYSIRPILKELQPKMINRKFVIKTQEAPIKGARIWVKQLNKQK